MPNFTPSTAKNHMRRSLMALLDPHPKPKDIDALWKHFGSRCAYCGKSLDRSRREGHRDHLISHASGGTNTIYNSVLACAACNGNEKRETDWKEFLTLKVRSPELRRKRRALIEAWRRKGQRVVALAPATRGEAEKLIETALASFDKASRRIRALRDDAI